LRLFLNFGIYPSYAIKFNKDYGSLSNFRDRRQAYIDDRFGALHFLKPILDQEEWSFLSCGDDSALQRMWAFEHGIKRDLPLYKILLAQIEEHRSDVFYNLDPLRYGSEFIRRLPGCVRYKLCWRAAPSPGADFSAYDRILCNFPGIIQEWRSKGWRADYFFPAHDPVMDQFAANEDRPIDICFVGSFTRHHQKRARLLENVAAMSPRYTVRFFLDASRLTKLAELKILRYFPFPFLQRARRPEAIYRITSGAIFGIELYRILSSSKIVINAAIDMAGKYRGNMRCFEAMGCGAAMLSDDGIYPQGMVPNENFFIYNDSDRIQNIIERLLSDPALLRKIGSKANQDMRSIFNKDVQWEAFLKILELVA
jgi:glycosyltransferase involved in cell wall biosynthesis